MSERLNLSPEAQKTPEAPRHDSEQRQSPERDSKRAETDKAPSEQLERSRAAVERLAKSAAEKPASLGDSSERSKGRAMPPTKELQAMARERILRNVRRKLPAPERALSKIMHTKPVEAVSAIGEKTIARPYGILGGGLSAFIGTALTFYMAKHYGFRYNLLLFFTFFVAGYLITTIGELIIKALRRK